MSNANSSSPSSVATNGEGKTKRIVLGVCAGIAAYKACELVRLLTESGHEVVVVPTRESLNFVGEPTWAALSGHPVATDVWSTVHEVPHVRLGQSADLVVVAPATADTLARAAQGLANDLLTNTLLTAQCPVVFAPAMHTEMWEHPATQANVATLRGRGAIVIEPAVGRLTGSDSGKGRLPDPAELYAVLNRLLRSGPTRGDLSGQHIVISAGGTRESIDPVRYLGNRSSGRQGYALARTAIARGAQVTLVAANVGLPTPAGAELVTVSSATDMHATMLDLSHKADVVVMAAAVADFRPLDYRESKIKKSELAEPDPIRLTKNPDILRKLVEKRHPGQLIVGFAAETDNVLEHGLSKLARKGCDLLIVNEVGADLAFGRPDNAAVILASDGSRASVPRGPKEDIADAIWDSVHSRLMS
ncbi:bifunctional phosphopantothenoylcysteine decarboxylase/phosphopantothenate--cysteine ligase CoaBC [Streptomyces sp. NBC_01563]|uniref:bifunctional phosphopantothenoylcysteine decarboxylase/phosphopantothenate--cysteine ligase CoaBC n=1 Tax=Streptomyces sp. NBC_01563 TaxID=2975880 RepID=UPI00386A5483